MKILLKKVRISYANIFDAKAFESGPAKFSASYLFPKDHPCVAQIKAAINDVAKEKWGPKADAVLKTINAAGKGLLHDGDSKESDGYAGNLFINASSDKRPSIVDKDGTTQLVRADGRPYSGCYVNAYIQLWAQDNQYGKRINASLAGIQFHSHGAAFGASDSTPDEFESVEDEEESLI